VTASAYPTGRSLTRLSKSGALALVAGCYALAGIAAALTVIVWRHHHPIAVALVADVVATVVIFVLSMIVANSSLYDAYWSVIPPVVAIAYAIVAPSGLSSGAQVRQVLVIVLVALWAIRLTANWGIGWSGLDHEDWRYVGLREGLPRGVPWWLVSFTGIQLMPTLVVFAGMLSLWPALGAPRNGFGVLDVVATIVTAAAIALETQADRQLHAFTRDPAHRGQPMERGLWGWSRHPNYLGEITFWWGLWLFGLAADPSWWWTVVSPVLMVLLFEAASIPMMEKRSLERRPAYADYQARVAKLLPLRRPQDQRSHDHGFGVDTPTGP
jgi:steroid 5-alpha reductase family enzyme